MCIISWLNLNQGLAQWALFLISSVACWVAYKEFILKRRPYIGLEILVSKNPDKKIGGWLFFATLLNNGTYPGVVKVKKTIMRVGDEEYPSDVKGEMIIPSGKSMKSALIGSIYKIGIERIKNNQYRNNRVEFEIEIDSKLLGSKKMQFSTIAKYEVNVRGKMPIITLISEKMT